MRGAGQGRPWGSKGTRDRPRLSTPGNLFPQEGAGVGARLREVNQGQGKENVERDTSQALAGQIQSVATS